MATLPRSFPALALAVAVLLTAFTISSAVKYRVVNDAIHTPGGKIFIRIGGPTLTMDTLERSGKFIFNTLNLPSDGNHREVNLITCIIDQGNAPTRVKGSQILINAGDLAEIPGDDAAVRKELVGRLFHLQTLIWLSTGNGQAPSGLLSGMADYVRYAAGYEPPSGQWVKPGEGTRWDQGLSITARFIAYCEGLKPGFAAAFNGMMLTGYSDNFFVQLLGQPPAELFSAYKAKFAS